MVMYDWVLPLLIAFVATYILMSILYNNSPELRQKFSDLGALIQLQTSRPYIIQIGFLKIKVYIMML